MPQILDYLPDDGYTEPGYIEPRKNLHGEFRFTYRPASYEERRGLGEVAQRFPAKYHDAASKLMAAKLLDWSHKDANGEPIKVSAEAIRKLKPQLFDRLHNIVCGYGASDTDPLWSDDKKDDDAYATYEAALLGISPAQAREARDAKN